MAKNVDLDKYVYSGYGIGIDLGLEFSLSAGSMGKNVIIFGVDMNSYVDTDNMKILVKGPAQGLDDTTLTEKAQYPIKF